MNPTAIRTMTVEACGREGTVPFVGINIISCMIDMALHWFFFPFSYFLFAPGDPSLWVNLALALGH